MYHITTLALTVSLLGFVAATTTLSIDMRNSELGVSPAIVLVSLARQVSTVMTLVHVSHRITTTRSAL